MNHATRLVLCAAALLLAGCFGPRAQVTRAFTFALPTQAPAEPTADAPVVRVRDLDPGPVVDRDTLVMRHSAVELRFPEELRWAQRPHRMIADALARALVDRGLASAAPRSLGDLAPRFELDGRLDRCEHDLSGGKSRARLELTLTLRRFADGSFVWRYHFAGEEPAGNSPEAGVAALSKLVDRALEGAFAAIGKEGPLRVAAPVEPDPAAPAR